MTDLIADNLETTGTVTAGELQTRYMRRRFRVPRNLGGTPPRVHAGAGSIRSPSVAA